MVKIARRSCGSAPPHLGAVASRIRSSPLESFDRMEPGWFLNIPPMSKASVLFLQPLAYRGKRGTQPGKLSTLHLGRVLIYSLVAKSHPFSRTCRLLWADDGSWRSGSSSLSLLQLARILRRRRVAVARTALVITF